MTRLNQNGLVFFLLTVIDTLARYYVSAAVHKIERPAYLSILIVILFENLPWLELITSEQVIVYELQMSRESQSMRGRLTLKALKKMDQSSRGLMVDMSLSKASRNCLASMIGATGQT